MFYQKIKIGDFVILFVAIALSILVLWKSYKGDTKHKQVVITTPKETYFYPLNKNRTLRFLGKWGYDVVEILDNAVRVKESSTPRKLCVLRGWLRHNGEWAACLPNKLFIRIEGVEEKSDKTEEDNVDTEVY